MVENCPGRVEASRRDSIGPSGFGIFQGSLRSDNVGSEIAKGGQLGLDGSKLFSDGQG